MIPDALHYITM